MSFLGHIEKGMVVFNEPVPLPDGTDVRVEPIADAASDFWRSRSLDDLARQQGVGALTSLDDAQGGWPDDELNDGFEAAVARWRADEAGPIE